MDLTSKLGESVRLTKSLTDEVDERISSPEERARFIWNILKKEHPELTDWDLVCFSSEYLGMQHVVYPWLENVSRQLLSMVYTCHYLHTEVINAESAIRREPVSREEKSHSESEYKSDSLRIVKSGEQDDGGS